MKAKLYREMVVKDKMSEIEELKRKCLELTFQMLGIKTENNGDSFYIEEEPGKWVEFFFDPTGKFKRFEIVDET